MRSYWLCTIVIFLAAQSTLPLAAQTKGEMENAALRYWVAFAQMQDVPLTQKQSVELSAILDGASFDKATYADLVAKNQTALESMARATSIPRCDWQLEYQLGAELPMEYARKGLALGRLNVLYALQLSKAGEREKAVKTLIAGLHFSRDLTSGGSLFVALAGKTLITAHLMAMQNLVLTSNLLPEQRSALRAAIARLGEDGVGWRAAAGKDLDGLRSLYPNDASAAASVVKIRDAYLEAMNAPGNLPKLKIAIKSAPPALANMIPDPERLLNARQELRRVISDAKATLK
jgi:hypothetical protein